MPVRTRSRVSRSSTLECNARENAFDITDAAQQRADFLGVLILREYADAVIALAQNAMIAERTIAPAPQQATAHRGGAAVDAGEQGIVAAAGEIRLEFEVAACGGIEQQGLVAALDVDLPNVRERGALRVARVLQQAAGGRDGGVQVGAAEAAQVTRAELRSEQARRRIAIEIPRRLAARAAAFGGQLAARERFAHQQLGRFDAREFIGDGGRMIELHHGEAAAAEIEPGEAVTPFVDVQRREQDIATLVQQGFFRERAGRDVVFLLLLVR